MSVQQVRRHVLCAIKASLLAAMIAPSTSAAFDVVAPNSLADTDGSTSSPTPTDQFRIQWLYLASEFTDIPAGGAFLVGHAIRADRTQSTEVTNTFAHSVFALSTTSASSLSPNLDANLGADSTIVFDGSTSITYPVDGPPGGPNSFGANIQYATPFLYDPSLGNLLIQQVTLTGNDIPGAEKDWHETSTNRMAFSFDPNSSSGTAVNSVIVTRFTFVPEPSSLMLMIPMIVTYGCLRRRWRHL